MGQKLVFRFLSGDNIGSSFSLSSGSYKIGTLDDCDIVIRERVSNNVVILLEITETQEVYVSLVEGYVLLNSKELTNTRTKLESKDIVAINFTSFAYFKDGDTLESFSLSNLLKQEEVIEDKKELENQSEETTVDNKAAQEQVEAKVSFLDRLTKTQKIMLTLFGLVLLILLFSSLIAGSYLYGKKSVISDNLSRAQDYIKSNDAFSGISVSFENDMLYFNGNVLTAKDKNLFVRNLPEFSYLTVFNVSNLDSVISGIKNAFSVYGCYFDVRMEDKSIVIYGYVKDPYVLGKIVQVISQDLHLNNVVYKVTFEEDLTQYIRDAQDTYDLSLNFMPKDFVVLYEDRFALDEIDKFAMLQKDVAKKVGAKVRFISSDEVPDSKITSLTNQSADIAFSLSDSTSDNNSVDANTTVIPEPLPPRPVYENWNFNVEDIIGVTLEPMRFVSMKNGDKYFEGATTRDGSVIKKIEFDKITLEKENKEFVYAFK